MMSPARTRSRSPGTTASTSICTEGAVALDLGLERHRAPQDFRGPDRVSFLHGVEPDRERQDQDDDRAADLVAGQHRDDAGGQQNQRQRLEQAAEHRAQQAVGLGRRVAVGAVLVEPPRGLVGASAPAARSSASRRFPAA